MWFGSPSTLNDPYDCLVPLRFAEVSLADCARLLRAKTDERWSRVAADRRYVDSAGNPTERLRLEVATTGENATKSFARESYASRGVACFSEVPDSTLLWSHYGGGHRGICLEFDTTSPWLSKLHRVRYTDEIPEINLVDELIGENSKVLDTLLTKASCWSYELEWRAIHQKANTVYCYGVDALTGVYLGAGLSEQELDLIAHILHGSPCQLHRVTRGEASFRLQSKPVTYTPFRYEAPKAV